MANGSIAEPPESSSLLFVDDEPSIRLTLPPDFQGKRISGQGGGDRLVGIRRDYEAKI